MLKEEDSEKSLHYTMSFIGGFLGAYAILNRGDLLGAAQTSNMIHLALNLAGGSLTGIMIRILAFALYFAGIMAAAVYARHVKFSQHLTGILIDGIAVLILGFLPADMDDMTALLPLFFAMAFQWCSFKGVGEYASATTFSTNNLRQFLTAGADYLYDRDERMKTKAKVYGCTLLAFHIGVAAGFPASRLMGIQSAWLCLIPLAGAACLGVWETGRVSDGILISPAQIRQEALAYGEQENVIEIE